MTEYERGRRDGEKETMDAFWDMAISKRYAWRQKTRDLAGLLLDVFRGVQVERRNFWAGVEKSDG